MPTASPKVYSTASPTFYEDASAAYVKGSPGDSLDGLAACVQRGDESASAAALRDLMQPLASIANATAKRYTGWAHTRGLTLDDLRQEAMLAMVECIGRWNPQKSTFKTYAVNNACYQVLDALNGGSIVSANRFVVQMGAAYIAGRRTKKMEEASGAYLQAAANAANAALSTEYRASGDPSGTSDGLSMGEALDATDVHGPVGGSDSTGEYEAAEMRADCRRVLAGAADVLNEREREVVLLRFASSCEGAVARTWKEIGRAVGVHQNYAQHVYHRALVKMRRRIEGNEVNGVAKRTKGAA